MTRDPQLSSGSVIPIEHTPLTPTPDAGAGDDSVEAEAEGAPRATQGARSQGPLLFVLPVSIRG